MHSARARLLRSSESGVELIYRNPAVYQPELSTALGDTQAYEDIVGGIDQTAEAVVQGVYGKPGM